MVSLFKSLFGGKATAPVKTASAAAVLPVATCDKNIPCFNWLDLLKSIRDYGDDDLFIESHPLFKNYPGKRGGYFDRINTSW